MIFSSKFWLTTTFLKEEFHPTTVHTFLMELVKEVFINQNPSIFPNLLESHFNLGASIDGILMLRQGDKGFCTLRWVNALYSPGGIPAPPSCPICSSVVPWGVKPMFSNQKPDQRIPNIHKGMFCYIYLLTYL